MTNEELEAVQRVTSMVQRLQLALFKRLESKGVLCVDGLIGAIFASYHYATELHGDPFAAIEWMRTTIDTIERQMLDQVKPQ